MAAVALEGHADVEEDCADSIVQPGKALKPGELLLWSAPNGVSPMQHMRTTEMIPTGDADSEDAVKDTAQLDPTSLLQPLLQDQHQAVMSALADQHMILLQVSNSMTAGMAPTPTRSTTRSTQRSRFGTSQTSSNPKTLTTMKSTETAKESKASSALVSEVSEVVEDVAETSAQAISPVSVSRDSNARSSASSKGQQPVKGRRPSFTPQLFSTFTHFDLGLQIEAARADGELSRKRFALMKNQSRSAGEVEDPCIYKFVTHVAFEAFFAVVVIVNSMFIGVEVQLQLTEGATLDSEFVRGVQYTFTALFTIELLLRLVAFGIKRLFCEEDRLWSVLDVVIVVSSLWETSLEILASNNGNSNISALKAFRVIRLTKILRTMRLIRIFRFVNALRMLITSIFHTLKSLFWALVLIALNVYVFAVLFVQAVVDFKEEPAFAEMSARDVEGIERYFSSIFMTMLSLFMSIAGGVSWEDVIFPLMGISWIWVACFIFYVSFTYFAVLNVVTAVFCQSAIESAQNDHVNVVQSILANKEAHKQKVGQLFNQLGAADESSGITFAMFDEKINSPEVREYFSAMGLDIWDAWTFFKLLDVDGGGEIEVEEFLMGCLRLRGQASAMDIQRIIHEQNWLIRSQGKFHTYMETEMQQMKDALMAMKRFQLVSQQRKPVTIDA